MRNEVSRRRFVVDLGKGGLAVAVLGIATIACSGDDSSAGPATTAATSGTPGEPETATTQATTTSLSATTETAGGSDGFAWERVNLGFVSAYVLARNGEAVVVDTGVAGSEADIEASLALLGVGWEDVGHVIVTHLHNDHQGSLTAVMGLAPDAAAYAGAADIAGISSPREIAAVGDGDRVIDLEIIETPGHTPGHISVLDRAGGLLIAGDALNGENGGIVGPNPQYSEDMSVANASVVKLAGFAIDTVVFGHGEPVVGNAGSLLAELASG